MNYKQKAFEFINKYDFIGGAVAIIGFLSHIAGRIKDQTDFNSAEHWRKRASELGQAAVIFGNTEYNSNFRNKQKNHQEFHTC
jgi:hypothetical protein